jgi:predicted nucleic acid-binding protein
VRFLDTNVFIRYLTRDDEKKAAACYELLQRVRRGQEQVATCEAIVTEVVYVLSSRGTYALSHAEIRARLLPLLALRGLKLPNKGVYRRALDIYANQPAFDFEDALLIAYMQRVKGAELYSYDRDFDREPGVRRIEP